MSLAKLKKSANRPIPTPEGPQKYKPVLLGDSIGAKIQKQKFHPQHRDITWWCEGGRNANSALSWIEENLETELQLIEKDIWLYILIGTCDFTDLNRKTRSIKIKYQNTQEIVDHLIAKYKQIIKHLEKLSPNSKCTILEIPFFSITEWNKKQREKAGKQKRSVDLEEEQLEEDHILEGQIIAVNQAIQQINQENNHKPSNFNSDLYRTSNRQAKKYKGKTESNRHGDTKSRRLYNITLLYDGIHPNYHLARAWLMKFTLQTIKDCWIPGNHLEAREPDLNNNSVE